MKKSDKIETKIDKLNKKILESKRIIKEEKKKIKEEKKNIRSKKYNKFKNTFIGRVLFRIVNLFKKNDKGYSFLQLFMVSLISLVIGIFVSFFVLFGGRNYFKLSKDLSKFYDVYETLIDNYYDEIDKEKLVEDAIAGMVSSVGDVYTSYTDTENVDEFNELVNGVYEGIGCTIQLQEDGVKIIEVFEDSPAEKAGVEENDIILKVDEMVIGKDTDVNELSNYIKTQSNRKIDMIILRGDVEKEISLMREKVETPVVATTIYEKNGKKIGYINISIFSSVASKQFENKLNDLENDGIDSLVIDVRGNSGGYLTTVTDIVNLLLSKGKIIYQIERDGKREVTQDKTKTMREYPIAILVNGSSASASEILAAAIKESYGGFVVGTKTYGKGTVQQVKELSDGSLIKYTVENWLTPNGNWIDGNGIEPTDKVDFNVEYFENPVVENDNQLQKALDLVSK